MKYLSFFLFLVGFILEMLLICWSGSLSFLGKTEFVLQLSEILILGVNVIFPIGLYIGILEVVKKENQTFLNIIGIILNFSWIIFLFSIWISIGFFGISA